MTASLLQPVVGYYTDRNPKPFSPRHGNGTDADWIGLPRVCHEFSLAPALGRTGRIRFGDLSPGIVARRVHGLGWPARIRPGVLSSGREHRHFHRPVVRGADRGRSRPAQRAVVHSGGDCGHRGPDQGGSMVSDPSPEDIGRQGANDAPAPKAQTGDDPATGHERSMRVMARTSPVRRPHGRAKDQNGSSGTKKKTAQERSEQFDERAQQRSASTLRTRDHRSHPSHLQHAPVPVKANLGG